MLQNYSELITAHYLTTHDKSTVFLSLWPQNASAFLLVDFTCKIKASLFITVQVNPR